MRVVAFNGSPRKDGNTAHLIRKVLGELERAGVDTEFVQVGGKAVRGCTACMSCYETLNGRCAITSDPVNDWIQKMRAADAVIIGSPTYFADVTSEIKALIDRAGFVTRVNGMELARKLGAAVVAVRRAGAVHAFDTINHFFLIGEMLVVGSNYWNLGVALGAGEVEQDVEGLETMEHLGRNMAWLLDKLAEEH